MAVHVDTFTANKSGGSQAVSNVTFRPKVIFFWGTLRTDTGEAAGDLCQFFGISNAEENACTTYAVKNGDDVAGYGLDDSCINLFTPDGTSLGRAVVSTLDFDGFTLTWEVAPTADYEICFMALAGAEIEEVKIGSFGWTSGTGNQAVTGVGFDPDLVMFLTGKENLSFPTQFEGANDDGFIGIGGMSNAGQWAVSAGAFNRLSTFELRGNVSVDHCIQIQSASIGISSQAIPVSLDADGFTINKEFSPNDMDVVYLAIKGGDWHMGASNAGATTGAVAESGFNFGPKSLLLLSDGNAGGVTGTDADSTDEPAMLTIGGVDGQAGAVAAAYTIQNAATTGAETGQGLEHDDDIALSVFARSTGGPTPADIADLQSLDADGFTLNWTTVAGDAIRFCWLAMGDMGLAVEADFSWEIIFADEVVV